MGRLVRQLMLLLVLAALVYGGVRLFGWIPPQIRGLAIVVGMFLGIALLWWYGGRIRNRASSASPRETWMAARATIRTVELTNTPAPAGRIGAHLRVIVEDPSTGSRWTTLIDTDVPTEAVGHFGTNTPVQVRYSPESKHVAVLDGEIPLDR